MDRIVKGVCFDKKARLALISVTEGVRKAVQIHDMYSVASGIRKKFCGIDGILVIHGLIVRQSLFKAHACPVFYIYGRIYLHFLSDLSPTTILNPTMRLRCLEST